MAMHLSRQLSRVRMILAAVMALSLALVLAGCSDSAPNERTVTLTFVRSAESEANAAGVINTEVPGPALSPTGQKQASALADRLKGGQYDGIYASQMARTQQTAAPLSKALGKQVNVLPGLDEMSSGWFNDGPASMTNDTFLLAPLGWLEGNRQFAIPGGPTGNEFNDKFSEAVHRIYQSGNSKPIAFSSGASLMLWTLMNVRNPKNSLVTDHPIPNAGRVVISGNPITGWKLVDWDGITDF
jgi:broad specificity phosphatase PhoE